MIFAVVVSPLIPLRRHSRRIHTRTSAVLAPDGDLEQGSCVPAADRMHVSNAHWSQVESLKVMASG